jgi:hypothetical protein
MRRREFVGLLAAIAISPQAVLAQTTKKRPLVGWLYYSRNDLAARYLGLVLGSMRESHRFGRSSQVSMGSGVSGT